MTSRPLRNRGRFRALDDGIRLDGQVRVDRGYTYTKPDTFARPLREAAVPVLFDLHPTQRAKNGNVLGKYRGALMIDGWFFASSTPVALWTPPPTPRGANKTQTAAHEQPFNERARYAFAPNGKPWSRPNGNWQLLGPARAGTVRCVNYEPSMTLSRRIPLTTCVKNNGCNCGATIVITTDLMEKIIQAPPYLWQTTAWSEAYNRRNLVESANAWYKFHRNLDRDSVRTYYEHRTLLHYYLCLIGGLIEQVRRWHLAHGRPDPHLNLDDNTTDRATPTDPDEAAPATGQDPPGGSPPG